jgi:hypothetical protein
MSTSIRAVLAICAGAALSACTIPIETDPSTFNVEPAAVAHLKSPVALRNGYADDAPYPIPMSHHTWVIQQRKLTDTAIAMLARALENRGLAVSPQSGKSVTLKVQHPSAAMQIYIGFANTYARVALEAEFGDGTRTVVLGENRSPMGAPRAFDGAVLFALNKLVLDETFVAYINRAGADPQKPSAPSPASSALIAAPAVPSASGTRFPRAGDVWTYRLYEPTRTTGPKQRDFIVRISAASPASVMEQVLIGNMPSGEATHGPGRLLLPLEKSLFSPYLLVFNEEAASLGSLGPLRIDDPVCAVHYHCEASGRVVAHERVTVPAGSFDAVRLEIEQNWQPATTTNSLATAQERGGRLLTVWYARDTKRAVKYRSRTSFGNLPPMETDFDLELVSYKLQ